MYFISSSSPLSLFLFLFLPPTPTDIRSHEAFLRPGIVFLLPDPVGGRQKNKREKAKGKV